MAAKPPLIDAIQRADIWSATETGFVPHYSLTSALPDYDYPLSEFEELDVRLADIMYTRIDRIPGQMLRLSMEYWARPQIALPAYTPSSGNTRGTYMVRYIQALLPTTYPDYSEVQALHYELSYTASGTPYVHRTLPLQAYTKTSWVDERFPAWRERSAVAKSLELSPLEFTAFLLEASSTTENLATLDLGRVQFE